jgi:undecaprenyl-diphosphatase
VTIRQVRLTRSGWKQALGRELAPLAAVGALAGAAFAFLTIAGEMSEGETRALDRAVLVALRDPSDLSRPIGPQWLKLMAIDLTSLGSLACLGLIVLMVAGLFASLRRFREAAILIASAGGGLVLSQLLKAFFGRARPDAVFQAVPAINASFPSGHAMLSAVVFLTLGSMVARFATRRRVKFYALASAILLTLIVGVSRVFLGVHWPTDVLAGWSLGAAWAIACWLVEWTFDRWRQEPAAED